MMKTRLNTMRLETMIKKSPIVLVIVLAGCGLHNVDSIQWAPRTIHKRYETQRNKGSHLHTSHSLPTLSMSGRREFLRLTGPLHCDIAGKIAYFAVEVLSVVRPRSSVLCGLSALARETFSPGRRPISACISVHLRFHFLCGSA